MKLYYSAGSCSTSCHIVLEESGLAYEAIQVDWDNPADPHLNKIQKFNPLGTLPIFFTQKGEQLDQNIAIQVYVAEQAPDKKLLPPVGTFEHSEALNWLSFVAADLHKAIGGMFSISGVSADPAVQQLLRQSMLSKVHSYLEYVETKLDGRNYLMGREFCVADAYAFVVLGWCQWLEIPLTSYKNILSYLDRVAARPAVARVLVSEGLV